MTNVSSSSSSSCSFIEGCHTHVRCTSDNSAFTLLIQEVSENYNNNNTHICIAPYGPNFRGAVARECASESEKGRE